MPPHTDHACWPWPPTLRRHLRAPLETASTRPSSKAANDRAKTRTTATHWGFENPSDPTSDEVQARIIAHLKS